MKVLNQALVFLWRCYFVLLATIGVLLVTIPILIYSSKPEYYPRAWKWVRFWGKFVFYGMGLSYDLKEFDQLNPNQTYLFISNHTSLLDIPLMMILCKNHPSVFVGKKELEKYPIFGYIYKRLNILVDRKDKNSRMRVFREAKHRVDLGRNIIIYPEGGVPNDESIVLDTFKEGAFGIAITSNIPIVIYTFIGLKEFFPYSYTRGKMGKVKVYLEKVLETQNLSMKQREDLKIECYNTILNRLNSHGKP